MDGLMSRELLTNSGSFKIMNDDWNSYFTVRFVNISHQTTKKPQEKKKKTITRLQKFEAQSLVLGGMHTETNIDSEFVLVIFLLKPLLFFHPTNL